MFWWRRGESKKPLPYDSILRINNNFIPSLGHFTEIIYHKNVRGHIVPLRGFILPCSASYFFSPYKSGEASGQDFHRSNS